jgi:hypothetical protein
MTDHRLGRVSGGCFNSELFALRLPQKAVCHRLTDASLNQGGHYAGDGGPVCAFQLLQALNCYDRQGASPPLCRDRFFFVGNVVGHALKIADLKTNRNRCCSESIPTLFAWQQVAVMAYWMLRPVVFGHATWAQRIATRLWDAARNRMCVEVGGPGGNQTHALGVRSPRSFQDRPTCLSAERRSRSGSATGASPAAGSLRCLLPCHRQGGLR